MTYFDLSISVTRIKLNKRIQRTQHIHCVYGKVKLTDTKIVVLVYYNNVDYTELML